MLRKVAILVLVLIAVTTAFNLPEIPLELIEDDDVISAVSDKIAEHFSQEYIKYIKTGKESATLQKTSKQLANSHSKKDIFNTSIADLSIIDQFFVCTTCRATVYVLVEMFRAEGGELNGPNAEAKSKKILKDLCNHFKIETPEVCSGLVDLNWDIVYYIIMNSKADARSLCGTLPIKICNVQQSNFNWSVKVDNSKGLLTAPKSEIPQKTENDLTFVHLTDIHFDPKYLTGALAECEEPLCCRQMPAGGIPVENKAGYWGDYRGCDSPLHMIKNALEHIKSSNKKIDYVFNTGDIVPHNIWSTTKESNKAILTQINDLIADNFPGIPVYPCVGNHEPHPTNVFGHEDVPANLNVNWLYKHLWTNWKRWLPAEAKATVLKGGYYTVSPKPEYRVISLNNMDCYIYNWWIYFDGNVTSQPQLDWLQETLLAAEKAGEYVHILAHIPSGDADCWTVWAREYNRIIERYSHIISGIFGGHTHRDDMNLHYSKNGHAMAIYWNGGSLTPYSYKNPNYRIYEIEPKTYQVVDHETWIFNLTEANERGAQRSPRWFKEYQFSDFTEDLSPAGIDALFDRMAEQPDLLRQYWRYKMTSSDPKLAAGCNEKCLSSTICNLVKTIHHESTRCKQLQAKLKESLAKEVTSVTVVPTEKPAGDGASTVVSSTTATVTLLFLIYHLF